VNTKSAWPKIIGIALLLAIILFLQACSPQGVKVSADVPPTVSKGERFEIRAKVLNTSQETQTLCDLDIADEYLDGIIIESTRPRYSEAWHVPIDNTMSYSFDLAIPPGEEKVVVLSAYAARPGDYSGEVDFCINTELNYLSAPVRTIIE
jgi:hypothetical protein